MNKSEIREVELITRYFAAGLGLDYAARSMSSLIRSARTNKSAQALMAHAIELGVIGHPEFIV
jgi:hypothetical protein